MDESFSPWSADLCKARWTHQLIAAHLRLQEHLEATHHPLTTLQIPHSGSCYTTLNSGQSPVGSPEQPRVHLAQLQTTNQPFCCLLGKDEAWLGFLHQLKGYFLGVGKPDREIEGHQFQCQKSNRPTYPTCTDLKNPKSSRSRRLTWPRYPRARQCRKWEKGIGRPGNGDALNLQSLPLANCFGIKEISISCLPLCN